MLILSRRVGQKIMIGDDIVVTFLGIDKKWGHIKIGFEAPPHIRIVREEIIGQEHPKYLSEEDLLCLQQHNTKS